jgi:SAM-dependent methyltransferase
VPKVTRHVRLRDLLVGVEGLALSRLLFEGDDATVAKRIEEVRRIVGESEAATFDVGLDVPERDARAGYAAWSDTYDDPGNPLIALEQPAMRAALTELPVGRALDAACGTGRHAGFLADRGHDVVGVDGSPEMLARAIAKVPGARFAQGDLARLPLSRGAVDAAICALALGHLADLGPPVRELARVIRPGGRLFISDLHPLLSFIGGQAAFRAGDGTMAFVREHPHPHGDYLRAFAVAGLEVRQCIEPRFDTAAAAMQGLAHHFIPEAAVDAYTGLPGALIWELERT